MKALAFLVLVTSSTVFADVVNIETYNAPRVNSFILSSSLMYDDVPRREHEEFWDWRDRVAMKLESLMDKEAKEYCEGLNLGVEKLNIQHVGTAHYYKSSGRYSCTSK